MKRRVSEKILKRIRVGSHNDDSGDDSDVAAVIYRWTTVQGALRRRGLNSGGTVCLNCAVHYGMDRC